MQNIYWKDVTPQSACIVAGEVVSVCKSQEAQGQGPCYGQTTRVLGIPTSGACHHVSYLKPRAAHRHCGW